MQQRFCRPRCFPPCANAYRATVTIDTLSPMATDRSKNLPRRRQLAELASSGPCRARLGGMCRFSMRELRLPAFCWFRPETDRRRTFMSDFRNSEFDYRNDPMRCDPVYDPDARAMNATWGWIAAAVFIVVVLAVAFGIGHGPNQSGTNTASND